MQAIVLREFGPAQNLRWETVPTPSPQRDEVLLKVGAVSVDLFQMEFRSGRALKVELPLTIKSGDQVVWHNVSGGPHNVQFWADSIPAGAAEPLAAGMPEQMSPLAGPLVVEPNGTYTVSFANTPAGEYKYYCLPHLANKMVAKITVTQ